MMDRSFTADAAWDVRFCCCLHLIVFVSPVMSLLHYATLSLEKPRYMKFLVKLAVVIILSGAFDMAGAGTLIDPRSEA